MKPALLFFAVVFLATACRQHKDSADDKMQQELSGTWLFEAKYVQGGNLEQTITVAPDGSYTLTSTMPGRTNGPRTISMEGTFRVEGGVLVDTVTKNSQTNAPVPSTNRSRIIRVDNHELALDYEKNAWTVYPTNEAVFRKQIE